MKATKNTKNFKLGGYEYIDLLNGGLSRRRIALEPGCSDFGKATIHNRKALVIFNYQTRRWQEVEE